VPLFFLLYQKETSVGGDPPRMTLFTEIRTQGILRTVVGIIIMRRRAVERRPHWNPQWWCPRVVWVFGWWWEPQVVCLGPRLSYPPTDYATSTQPARLILDQGTLPVPDFIRLGRGPSPLPFSFHSNGNPTLFQSQSDLVFPSLPCLGPETLLWPVTCRNKRKELLPLFIMTVYDRSTQMGGNIGPRNYET
jgi:hypothetical protein